MILLRAVSHSRLSFRLITSRNTPALISGKSEADSSYGYAAETSIIIYTAEEGGTALKTCGQSIESQAARANGHASREEAAPRGREGGGRRERRDA